MKVAFTDCLHVMKSILECLTLHNFVKVTKTAIIACSLGDVIRKSKHYLLLPHHLITLINQHPMLVCLFIRLFVLFLEFFDATIENDSIRFCVANEKHEWMVG